MFLLIESERLMAPFGSLADDRGQMTGAWSIGANPEDCVSIVDALKERGRVKNKVDFWAHFPKGL